MKDYPRSTLAFLYMFHYDTMFLPFAHVVCPISPEAPKYDFTDVVNFNEGDLMIHESYILITFLLDLLYLKANPVLREQTSK